MAGLREEAEDGLGLALVGALAAQRREAQQPHRGRGVAGGDRVVADLLAAGDQPLVVVRGRKEAAALGVAEAGDHRLGELAGLLVPALLEARFVERQQRLEQEGVVLEVGVEPRLAVLEGAQQAAPVVAQLAEDELGALARRLQVVVALEDRAGLGESGDRQRVPRGEALVVEPRADTPFAGLEQRPSCGVRPPARRFPHPPRR